ncbi:AbiEi antitoxin N-terminal domain-containing protein [Chromohalobacter sp. 296-RDG]|uniref:AbiEi antitoxin N-terminal domain-containing protein n=1 Tax=Chromohalobacter sp. 296-RDG TaxID=2994062 RepID=UPI00246895C9|nr:AbiEi antitoxin N-terminal domain-containing protein [Chromohalobacter sp. 296-RDG]
MAILYLKINQLLHKISHGAVVTTAWLASHGVTSDQARKLADSGWLQRVGHGAYCQAGEPLSWESAVFAMQASDDPGFGQVARRPWLCMDLSTTCPWGRAQRICMARRPFGCPGG